ncbi:MAG: hypothetical protein R3234_13760, partial [Thermoanaerobaculia bacterium]|nr:hypothetical protein [Thermoanaerobaculia bacterium]
RRVGLRLAGIEGSAPVVSDPRTMAQLRAATRILGTLDRVQAKRERVQARRTRSDEELRSRFPPVVVPTYPGDEDLFRDPGFRALLPTEIPWREAGLTEIMEWDPAPERAPVEDP